MSFIGLGLPIITNLCFKSLILVYIDLIHIKLYDINLSSKFASFLEYKMAKYLRPGFWEHCCCCSRLLRQSCQHHSHCRLWLVGTCILIEPFHCVHLHKWDIIFYESYLCSVLWKWSRLYLFSKLAYNYWLALNLENELMCISKLRRNCLDFHVLTCDWNQVSLTKLLSKLFYFLNNIVFQMLHGTSAL